MEGRKRGREDARKEERSELTVNRVQTTSCTVHFPADKVIYYIPVMSMLRFANRKLLKNRWTRDFKHSL